MGIMPPKYSICITHYNNADTLEASLQSILSQIDSRFEIVVVDNMSTDGSREMLEKHARAGILKLVVKRCSIGRGRQIAFENSGGDYIISNVDFDDQFLPKLSMALAKYEESCNGDLLRMESVDERNFWGGESFNIAPRALLKNLGGWHDLQLGEDWELSSRAGNIGKYKWTYFRLLAATNAHPERKTHIGRMRFRFVRYRDMMRSGRRVFKEGDSVGIGQRIPFIAAAFLYRFYQCYGFSMRKDFDPRNPSLFVDFGERPPRDSTTTRTR